VLPVPSTPFVRTERIQKRSYEELKSASMTRITGWMGRPQPRIWRRSALLGSCANDGFVSL